MTQMGLDYRKYLLDKEIRPKELAVKEFEAQTKQQDADTRKYTASFEPLRVEISGKSADAAMLKAEADTRKAAAAERDAETREYLGYLENFPEAARWNQAMNDFGYDKWYERLAGVGGQYAINGAKVVWNEGVKALMGSGFSMGDVQEDDRTRKVHVSNSRTGEEMDLTYDKRRQTWHTSGQNNLSYDDFGEDE